MPSNNTRIAKNTFMLYFRQILILLINLYTVRIVLEILGAEDYGIYNVVAGVITMSGFLTNSMAASCQRFFSFALGNGDFIRLKKVFSLSLAIYVLIGILVLILAETVGLWFVFNKLVIPLERKKPAIWAYQFSLISFLFSMLASPYMAMIIAHEEMKIYAYVSIVEVSLKLVIVLILRFIVWDKLVLYGLLMTIVTIINTSIYRVISTAKYKVCKYSFYWNYDLFKEIVKFSGWNMFGSSVRIFKNQIVNILLNQYFNPVVVTARSIAASVDSAAMSLSQNFNTAMRPQIIKCFAAGEKKAMFSLIFRGSKGTYLLMYLFFLPLMLEMPVILGIWLKNPPEYAVLFTRLMLFDVLITSISYPIMTAAQATGNLRMYQSVVGGILLLNVPISWLVLNIGAPAYSVLIIAIILAIIAFIARLIILKRLVNYSIEQFLRIVLVPILVISVLSVILPVIILYSMTQSIIRLCFVTAVCAVSISLFSYYIGFNREERGKIKNIISKYIFLQGEKQ